MKGLWAALLACAVAQAQGDRKLSLGLREAVEMAAAPGGAARAELAREAARAREAAVAATFRQRAARIDLGAAVGNLDLMLD